MLNRLMLVLLVLLGTSQRASAEETDSERYYSVELDGEKIGWGLERTSEDAHGRIFSSSEMHFSIARGPITIDLVTTSEFFEDADGTPSGMSVITRQGSQVTRENYFWREEGHVDHTTDANGRVRTERIKAPTTPWLTPSKVDALVKRKLAEGAKRIAYATLDPSFGIKPVLTKVEVLGSKQVEVLGKTVSATEWRTTSSATPGIIMTSYVDDDGEALLTELPLGGLQLTVRAASRDEALTAFNAPELMVSTLCKPDRMIDNPRFVQRAVYTLRGIAGDLPDLPFTGAQKVEAAGDGGLRLTLDLDANTPAELTAEDRAACLAPATMADSEDPMVVAHSMWALRRMKDATDSEKAEELRLFTAELITDKSLDVGFGSASAVARTREGDCTEHAVLLVALLRNADIPARTVSGLVYIDQFMGKKGVFGYHMWAQALLPIDDANPDAGFTWRDLDAAIPTRPCDATHIALTTTDLRDGALATSMTDVARVLGNLRITVESVEYVNTTVDAP